MANVHENVDILIVGGGLIGAALCLALHESGYVVRLLEAKAHTIPNIQPNFDARSLALTQTSVEVLQKLGIWPKLLHETCAIRTIHVSEKGRFGHARMQAPTRALGYVVEMQHLSRALFAELSPDVIQAPATVRAFNPQTNQAEVEIHSERRIIQARLVIAADGAESSMRQFCRLTVKNYDYQQLALVANIGLSRDHQHIAYERFTSKGPLALLPMTAKRAALIWSLPPEEAREMANMSEAQFLTQLQRVFGYRLGRLRQVGQRSLFPLRQVYMPQISHRKVVFIGNAAQTLHPVAGQGFNLGLRDVAMLVQCINDHGLSAAMHAAYQQARKHDQMAIRWATHQLVNVFTHPLPGLGLLRGLGLLTIDNVSSLQHLIGRYAQGRGGLVPDLMCGDASYGV